MRLSLAVCLALITAPVFAQDTLRVIAASPEAQQDAQALADTLTAALAPGAARADCPLKVSEDGEIAITVSHVAGPPAGWSLTVGPVDAPLASATGVAGESAAAASDILEKLCPKQGGAATHGPWTATGGGPKIVISGTVQNLLAPFTLQGEFPGGRAVFEYTPVNIGGGSVEYTLSGSGVTGSGEGLYSLKAMPNDVFILEQTTDGCVDGVPNSCRQNSDVIALTPVGQ